jgi:hypothetical protein
LDAITDPETREFIELLGHLQRYNHHYRTLQLIELLPLFEEAIGPMERNSEGTDLWIALGLAIKELYGMRKSTLAGVLRQVTVRK